MSLIIVLVTIGVSVYAFYNRQWFESFSLKPYLVFHKHQWHRVFSHVLVHADWAHLLVNMYVLFIFGSVCESYFAYHFSGKSNLHIVMLYALSIIFSSVYTIAKFRNNRYYSAVGASGAVMAVVFTSIFFDPWNKLWFFGIIPVPGIVFGSIYLGYSYYMSKKNVDNIGHDAHFAGAIFGLLYPLLIDFSLLTVFFEKLIGGFAR
jgi:membrane associated rhomboid family serine protease